MKTIDVLAIGVRLLGLYFVMKFIQYLGSAYVSYQQVSLSMPDFNPLIIAGGYAISAIVMLVFCMLFIKFPAIIASKLLPRTNKDSTVLSGDAAQLQLAGFSLIGIYILSWAIPDLVHNSALLAVMPSYNPSYSMSDRPYDLINFGVTVIEILIGLYLVLQAKGVIKLIDKFRYVGQ
jgi:hypothetical protein